MAFFLEVSPDFEKEVNKLSKKNPELKTAVKKKVNEILENPYRFKPLRAPLHGFRRVHLLKSFVLVFRVKEKEKAVLLVKIAHHDSAYQ